MQPETKVCSCGVNIRPQSSHCRRCSREARNIARTKDHRGDTFGFLTVLDNPYVRINRTTKWLCQCVCGREKYFNIDSLKKGTTVSCGCKRRELHRTALLKARPTHLVSVTRFHNIKIKAERRGLQFTITREYLEELWLKQKGMCAISSVVLELTYRMSTRNTASLDRIDSSKGYEVGNVQWVHKKINQMKMDLSETAFKVYAFLTTKKFQEDLLKQVGWTPLKEVS